MFKRIVLAVACVAAFGAASLATPDTADAGWRYRGRPYYGSYYGRPRYYGYYRPYRSYYRSYYRPYRDYYYGGYYPRYYRYSRPYYYDDYYYPRSSVSFSFGW